MRPPGARGAGPRLAHEMTRLDTRSHGLTLLVIYLAVSAGIAIAGYVSYAHQREEL